MCEYIFVEDKEGAADQALNRIVYHGISTWRPFEQSGNTHRWYLWLPCRANPRRDWCSYRRWPNHPCYSPRLHRLGYEIHRERFLSNRVASKIDQAKCTGRWFDLLTRLLLSTIHKKNHGFNSHQLRNAHKNFLAFPAPAYRMIIWSCWTDVSHYDAITTDHCFRQLSLCNGHSNLLSMDT